MKNKLLILVILSVILSGCNHDKSQSNENFPSSNDDAINLPITFSGTNISHDINFTTNHTDDKKISLTNITLLPVSEFFSYIGISFLYYDNGKVAIENTTNKEIDNLLIKDIGTNNTFSISFDKLPPMSRAWTDLPQYEYEVIDNMNISASHSVINNNTIEVNLKSTPFKIINKLKITIKSRYKNKYILSQAVNGNLLISFEHKPMSEVFISISNSNSKEDAYEFIVKGMDFGWKEEHKELYHRGYYWYAVDRDLISPDQTSMDLFNMCKEFAIGDIKTSEMQKNIDYERLFNSFKSQNGVLESLPYHSIVAMPQSDAFQYVYYDKKTKTIIKKQYPIDTKIKEFHINNNEIIEPIGFICATTKNEQPDNPNPPTSIPILPENTLVTPDSGDPEQVPPEWFIKNFNEATNEIFELCKSNQVDCSSVLNQDSLIKLGNNGLSIIPQQKLIKFTGDIFVDGIFSFEKIKNKKVIFDTSNISQFGNIEWSNIINHVDKLTIDLSFKLSEFGLNYLLNDGEINLPYSISFNSSNNNVIKNNGVITLWKGGNELFNNTLLMFDKVLPTHDKYEDYNFDVTLNKVDKINGAVSSITDAGQSLIANPDDISILKNNDGTWTFINHTMSHIKKMTVIGDDNKSMILDFNKKIPSSHSAIVVISGYNGNKLINNNQLNLHKINYTFNDVNVDGYCATNNKSPCYEKPTYSDRVYMERAPSWMYKHYNQVNYREEHKRWMSALCSSPNTHGSYAECKRYQNTRKEGDWDWWDYSFIKQTPQGKTLNLRVLERAGGSILGVGSGSTYINNFEHAILGGWSSAMQRYFNVNTKVSSYMWVWTHETDHAFGFLHHQGHTDGVTTNYARKWTNGTFSYDLNTTDSAIQAIASLLVTPTYDKNKRTVIIKLTQTGNMPITRLGMRVMTADGTLHKIKQLSQDTFEISVPNIIDSAIHIQMWDIEHQNNDNKYINMFRIGEYQLNKNIYVSNTTGQAYFPLTNNYIIDEYKGAYFYQHCKNFKYNGVSMEPITKNNINDAYNAIREGGGLSQLQRKYVISNDLDSKHQKAMQWLVSNDSIRHVGWDIIVYAIGPEVTTWCGTTNAPKK